MSTTVGTTNNLMPDTATASCRYQRGKTWVWTEGWAQGGGGEDVIFMCVRQTQRRNGDAPHHVWAVHQLGLAQHVEALLVAEVG